MKVFLIIVGIILISEAIEFILKVINSFLGKKQLESEVAFVTSGYDMEIFESED